MSFTFTKSGQSRIMDTETNTHKPKTKPTKPGTELVLSAAQYTTAQLDRNMDYFENF